MISVNKSILVTLFTLFASNVFAQQSDHKIKTDFIDNYSDLSKSITQSKSVFAIDSIEKELIKLDDKFIEYSELLDNALYPSSYKIELVNLFIELKSTEQRLLIIENQNERLDILTQEVSNYKFEISFLNKRADSLHKAIKNSQLNEVQLSKLVKRYRTNLELRDELVMSLIDSLMITYIDMTINEGREVSDQSESGRVSSTNPLEMLVNIIEENIEYTSNSNQVLYVEDRLRMYAMQHHFEEVWNKIGDNLLIAYGGSQKTEWNSEINSKMRDWRMVTSQKMWNSVDHYLEFSSVELEAFDNNYSFFIALDNFIKNAQKKSDGRIISKNDYEDYKNFQGFWSNKVKNEWSTLIRDSEFLTVAQISSIDDQLIDWESESRPIHPLFLVLLVLTVISISGYILVLSKSKKLN